MVLVQVSETHKENDMWGVDSDDNVYERNDSRWKKLPESHNSLKCASVDYWCHHVIGVNAGGNTYYQDLRKRDGWTLVAKSHTGNKIVQVSLSGDANHVWAVAENDNVYYLNMENFKKTKQRCTWTRIHGGLTHVSADYNGNDIWGVSSSGDVWYRNGKNGSWKHIGGIHLTQISVSGDDDDIWGVTAGGDVYHRNGKNGSWTKKKRAPTGTATYITVNYNNSRVWMVTNEGNLYILDQKKNEWSSRSVPVAINDGKKLGSGFPKFMFDLMVTNLIDIGEGTERQHKIGIDGKIEFKLEDGEGARRYMVDEERSDKNRDAYFIRDVIEVAKEKYEGYIVSAPEAKDVIGQRHALFAMHGFNVSMADFYEDYFSRTMGPRQRTANHHEGIAAMNARADVMLIPIIWRNNTGVPAYNNDRFIHSVKSSQAFFASFKGVAGTIRHKSIMVHSMGNRVMQLAATGSDVNFDNIFMMAADVDRCIFHKDNAVAKNMYGQHPGLGILNMLTKGFDGKPIGKIGVCWHMKDGALRVSPISNFKGYRLGKWGPHTYNVVGTRHRDPSVTHDDIRPYIVEFEKKDTEYYGTSNHSYHNTDPAISRWVHRYLRESEQNKEKARPSITIRCVVKSKDGKVLNAYKNNPTFAERVVRWPDNARTDAGNEMIFDGTENKMCYNIDVFNLEYFPSRGNWGLYSIVNKTYLESEGKFTKEFGTENYLEIDEQSLRSGTFSIKFQNKERYLASVDNSDACKIVSGGDVEDSQRHVMTLEYVQPMKVTRTKILSEAHKLPMTKSDGQEVSSTFLIEKYYGFYAIYNPHTQKYLTFGEGGLVQQSKTKFFQQHRLTHLQAQKDPVTRNDNVARDKSNINFDFYKPTYKTFSDAEKFDILSVNTDVGNDVLNSPFCIMNKATSHSLCMDSDGNLSHKMVNEPNNDNVFKADKHKVVLQKTTKVHLIDNNLKEVVHSWASGITRPAKLSDLSGHSDLRGQFPFQTYYLMEQYEDFVALRSLCHNRYLASREGGAGSKAFLGDTNDANDCDPRNNKDLQFTLEPVKETDTKSGADTFIDGDAVHLKSRHGIYIGKHQFVQVTSKADALDIHIYRVHHDVVQATSCTIQVADGGQYPNNEKHPLKDRYMSFEKNKVGPHWLGTRSKAGSWEKMEIVQFSGGYFGIKCPYHLKGKGAWLRLNHYNQGTIPTTMEDGENGHHFYSREKMVLVFEGAEQNLQAGDGFDTALCVLNRRFKIKSAKYSDPPVYLYLTDHGDWTRTSSFSKATWFTAKML